MRPAKSRADSGRGNGGFDAGHHLEQFACNMCPSQRIARCWRKGLAAALGPSPPRACGTTSPQREVYTDLWCARKGVADRV
jgi:hypothetical protein